jgi:predicted transcriptional regulator
MARTPKDIPDAQLAVLQRLWDYGSATIRQLTETLYSRGDPSAYATVQKLLERLEKKGFVRRRRTEQAHTFEAVLGRDDLIGRRLRAMAEKLCGGSLTPLLTHLVRARRLSPRERQDLRDLIDALDKEKRAPRR